MKTDLNGILCQVQDDGSLECGDGANWTGHHLYLYDNDTKVRYARAFLKLFEVSFGAYVRHPDPTMTNNGFGAHYKNPWNGCISRDQLTGIIGALVATGQHWAMLRLIIHHAAWLFLFSYNTIKNGRDPKTAKWKWPDLTGPDIWSMELRGLGLLSYLLWPLMLVTDLHILIASIIQRLKVDGNDDPISFTMKLMCCREFKSTPWSWAAWKITDKEKLVEDLEEYWSGWREQPEMRALYVRKFRAIGWK